MPFKIQRVPRGLNDLLAIFGGGTPVELEDRVRGSLDFLQFYGLTQQQFPNSANAALAEAGVVSILVPSNQVWVLFSVNGVITKTATMTAAEFSIGIGITLGASSGIFSSGSLAPFGATETGVVQRGFCLPYPRILLPGSQIFLSLSILGTDATANVGLNACVGVLG